MGLVMMSVTNFTPSIFAAFDKTPQKTDNSFSNVNQLGAFDIYNQVIKNQFLIIDSADIPSLFPKTAEEIEFSFHFVKNNTTGCLRRIISISAEARNFENTVLEYDKALAYFRIYGSIIATLKMTHPDKKIRKKAEEILINWTDFMVDSFETNKEIYRSFKEYESKNKELLNEERLYYFSNAMINFNRAGLELNPQQYIEMKDLQKQIALLSVQFHSNIAQDTSILHFDKKELSGINEDFLNDLTQDSEGYALTCDYPTYFQVMTNCSIESTRKKYLYMFNNRAFPQNMSVLNTIINCRDALAHLLGYKSYADYDVVPEMAQTRDAVEKFLDDLSLSTHSKIKTNWSILINDLPLPPSVILTQENKIKPWDVAYLANQYIKKHFHIDQNEIADYFPMEKTIRNLLNVYEKFFNINFQIINSNSYWDSSIQTIEVRRKEGDQSLIGYILLDLFPRDNKYSHCCCNCIIPPLSFDGGQTFEPALTVVIANFSKSTKEKPSLLRHHEVKTFFHEFGHAIHALFGKAEMPTKAAYNTKVDFIETPSQLLEEWMWDRDILKMISHHYQTENSLPDSMIDGLIKTRNITDAAHDTTGGNSDHEGTELLFAKLSWALFKEGRNKDIPKIHKEIYNSTPQIVSYDPELHHVCAFGHLTAYGAKYYSYPWSKQLALKIFRHIKSHGGLLDPIMGQRYISKIIGRGGSCDPNILITDFIQEDRDDPLHSIESSRL